MHMERKYLHLYRVFMFTDRMGRERNPYVTETTWVGVQNMLESFNIGDCKTCMFVIQKPEQKDGTEVHAQGHPAVIEPGPGED